MLGLRVVLPAQIHRCGTVEKRATRQYSSLQQQQERVEWKEGSIKKKKQLEVKNEKRRERVVEEPRITVKAWANVRESWKFCRSI